MLDLAQPDLARDYGTGWQLAVADGRQAGVDVRLDVQWVQRTESDLTQALRQAAPDTAAVVGVCGESLALDLWPLQQSLRPTWPLLGPWLADSRHDGHADLLPLFASRATQLQRALTELDGMGVQGVAVVWGMPADENRLGADLNNAAKARGIRLHPLRALPGEDLVATARRVARQGPPLLLFIGGSIELAQFNRGLAEAGAQRLVVALADVDPGTLMQLGRSNGVAVALAQVVPNAQRSQLPVVRKYRSLLDTQFDEPPGPMSLAGYLAGAYICELIKLIREPTAWRTALAARPTVALDGFTFGFPTPERGSDWVGLSLLRADGRLTG